MFGYVEFPKVNFKFCTWRNAELEDVKELWKKLQQFFGFSFLSSYVDLKSNVDATETSKKCCLNVIAQSES